MMEIITLIRDFIEVGPWYIIAIGGFVIALVVELRLVRVPFRHVIACVAILISAYATGVISGKDVTGRKLDAAEERIKVLEAERELRIRQTRELTRQAIERAETNEQLSGIITRYEEELENGQANRCVADPVYNNRLHTILEQLPGN